MIKTDRLGSYRSRTAPSHPHSGEKKDVDMLNSMKSSAPEKDRNALANATEVMRRMVQPYDPALGEAGADDESGNRLLHWLRNVRGHGQSEYDRNPDNYTLPVGTRRPLDCDYCKSPNLFALKPLPSSSLKGRRCRTALIPFTRNYQLTDGNDAASKKNWPPLAARGTSKFS
jgi:hypothetical protein